VFLYGPRGVFGWVIWLKTWHNICHCETFYCPGYSLASRDGQGVGIYPFRRTQLLYVLRPVVGPPDSWITRADEWALSLRGTPAGRYGWLELLGFFGFHVRSQGMICSQFVTEYIRRWGWNIFPTEDADAVAPFEFLLLASNGMEILYDAALVSV